jgi:hypothetical protein
VFGEVASDPSTWVWDVDLPLIAPYNWGEFGTLIGARNELLVRFSRGPAGRWLSGVTPDIANRIRMGWMAALGPGAGDLVIRPTQDDDRARLLVLGDPGEGDLSQWALRRPVLARAGDETGGPLDFAVVLSDVVYAAGQAKDYRDRFHGTLRELTVPVYAIPGNHDWDDGTLASFMHTFVARVGGPAWPRLAPATDDSEPLPDWIVPTEVRQRLPAEGGLRGGLWFVDAYGNHGAFRRLASLRAMREAAVGESRYPHGQPAPYFAVDAAGALLVAIDQGFSAAAPLDDAQSRWLVALLEDHRERPVILLVGKPFASHGERRNRQELAAGAGWETLQGLVAAHPNVVAVIGGDVHNYQHYRQAQGPDLIVAGGSGAYMSGTVGTAEALAGQEELRFDPVLYPTEAQSERYLQAQFRDRLGKVPVSIAIAAVGAAVAAAAGSVWAVAVTPAWPRDLGIGLAVLAFAAALWALWADTDDGRRRGVLGTVAFAAVIAGVAIAHVGALAWVTDPETARLAALIATPTAIGLVAAAFLPFGVLSQVFPLPSQRIAPGVAGAVNLTWLLAVAYPALAGAGVLATGRTMEVVLVATPTLLVACGYLAPRLWSGPPPGRRRSPAQLAAGFVLVTGLLLLLLAHVSTDWGPRVTLAIAGLTGLLVAALVVTARLLAARGGRPADEASDGIPRLAIVVVAAGAAAGWVALVDRRVDTHPGLAGDLGAALMPALLLALTAGAVTFLLIRLLGHLLTESTRFIGWLAQPHGAVDAWSVLETAEPPFYKSFLEVEVDRARREIIVTCWGVSGFEADAADPIRVETFRLAWPEAASG